MEELSLSWVTLGNPHVLPVSQFVFKNCNCLACYIFVNGNFGVQTLNVRIGYLGLPTVFNMSVVIQKKLFDKCPSRIFQLWERTPRWLLKVSSLSCFFFQNFSLPIVSPFLPLHAYTHNKTVSFERILTQVRAFNLVLLGKLILIASNHAFVLREAYKPYEFIHTYIYNLHSLDTYIVYK